MIVFTIATMLKTMDSRLHDRLKIAIALEITDNRLDNREQSLAPFLIF